jgi:hypothetical protein
LAEAESKVFEDDDTVLLQGAAQRGQIKASVSIERVCQPEQRVTYSSGAAVVSKSSNLILADRASMKLRMHRVID